MTSKSDILARIRSTPVQATPLPASPTGITYPDREKQFAEVLASVGGHCVLAEDLAELDAAIQAIPSFANAKQIVSCVPSVEFGTLRLADVSDPHELSNVDLAILPGEFAVAENGAVWVSARSLPERVLFFITQHLVLVVPRTELTDNLHQAYERLRFVEPGYGLFISGPSKTADIEQSLVIGAHGARSLTVILLG